MEGILDERKGGEIQLIMQSTCLLTSREAAIIKAQYSHFYVCD